MFKPLLLLTIYFLPFTVSGQGNFQVVYNSMSGVGYAGQSGLHYMMSCGDSTIASIDTNGSVTWTKHLPFSIQNFKIDPQQRLWCGGVEPFTNGTNAVMSLLDTSGNIVWKRTYNSTWTLSRIGEEKLFNNSCYFLVYDND